MKQYTALRKFYAWVGFLTLIFLIIVGVAKAFQSFDSRDQKLMENNYCHIMRDDGTVFAWKC